MSDSQSRRPPGGHTMIAGSGGPPSAPPSPSVAPGPASVAPAAAAASVAPTPSSPPGAPVAEPAGGGLVGTVLSDRYRIIKKLGEGGMGSVYLAEHTTINKKLAIKVLSSEYSHKQDLVDRFLQEARAASMIEQENVVEITDFGSTPTGSVFFVMEFLNGEDLSKTVKTKGPLPWARVKPIMIQICRALASAHDAGIIHRDMKPENCYRIRRGDNPDFIKVLDFGIAKVTSDDGEGKGLTRTGMIFGTPEYMSPEQAKGEKVDHRVDVYAVGVILYELLTGRVPFTADTFMGILTKHMFEAPPAPSTIAPIASIPHEVEAIVLKALQKDREYRFQSMRELMGAIDAVGTGAAAVSVVAEDVVVPQGGETKFQTSSPTPTSMQMAASTQDEIKVPGKAGMGLLLGIGAVVLAGLGGLAVFVISNQDEPADKDPVAAAGNVPDATKEVKNVPPEEPPADDGSTPEVPPTAEDEGDAADGAPPVAAPATVAITINTPGVDADVFDERDDAKLGSTNEAFDMPLGTDSLDLYVRAEGYEDFLIAVIPDADKALSAPLTKETPASPVKQPNRGNNNKKKKKTPKKDPVEPAVAKDPPKKDPPKKDPPKKDPPKKDPPSGSGSPDLKDPFAK